MSLITFYPYCRLSLQRQGHHRHPAAPGGGQAAHDEGEMVEREWLSRGGQQGGQRSGRGEHWWNFYRAGGRTCPLSVCSYRRVYLQIQKELGHRGGECGSV